MFSIEELKAAHAKVKTGADFPLYIKELQSLGLITYEFLVTNGSTVYYAENHPMVEAPAIYPSKPINLHPSPELLEHFIAIHQQGKTDFFSFCSQAAQAGVFKWQIDTQKMLCTYFDTSGKPILAEPIPQTGG